MQSDASDQPRLALDPPGRPLILYVEDDVLIRIDTAEALRLAGYAVVEAASGEEALTLLQAGARPDLLLSDLRMPGPVDGAELLGRLEAIAPATPRLLVTSHLTAGPPITDATAFLAKPYTGAALLEAVARLVPRP